MASFDTIYTGKGLAPSFPSDGGKAMSRLSDLIIKIEEVKYNAFQKNKDWYLKQIDVDPAVLISAGAQTAQKEALDVYSQAGRDMLKRVGGDFSKLSADEQTTLITAKNVLTSKQNELLAMQKMWEEEDTLVKKNPVDFDEEEHALKTIKFATEGNFDYNSLPYRPLSIADELIKIKGKIGATKSITAPIPGNTAFQQTIETTGTREELAPIIVDSVFRNPRIKKDMLNKWNALPQVEKDGYLETDNKPGISEAERRAGETPTQDRENPILKFYIDENYKYGVLENPGTPQRIATTTTVVKGAPTKVAGATVNIFPGERAMGRTYGGNVYSNDSFSFGGNTTLYGIPTAGAKLLTGSWTDNVDPGSVNGRLVLYDPQKRVFLIETSSASGSAETATKVLLEVPESSISNAENVPIIIDGKQTTIGDYLKNTPVKKGGILD